MILNILIFFVLSVLIPNALISVSISSIIVYWRTKEVKFLTLPIAYYIMHNMLDYVHETFVNGEWNNHETFENDCEKRGQYASQCSNLMNDDAPDSIKQL